LLAARWWSKVRGLQPGDPQPVPISGQATTASPEHRLAHQAWLSDIQLMLDGCRQCWTYKLLTTMEQLHVINASQWRGPNVSSSDIQKLTFAPAAISAALSKLLQNNWITAVAGQAYADPRAAPSIDIPVCTHSRWVCRNADPNAAFGRRHAPRYMMLCLPFKVLQCLARLRIGTAQLEVQRGRQQRPLIPRSMRICPLCSCATSRQVWRGRMHARSHTHNNVEDLLHFISECPAYDHLREARPEIFWAEGMAGRYDRRRELHAILAHENQEHLAVVVYQMWLYRSTLLGLASADDVSVPVQPDTFVPQDASLDAVLRLP